MATIKPSMSMDKILNYLKKYKNIKFKSGTYNLTAPLVVYSGCTVTCEDGVVFQRKSAGHMLEVDANSNLTGFNGTHDVKWTGGTFIASTLPDQYANVIVLYHSKNIEFHNMTVDGCQGLHSIECNSSKNVLIDNCTFKNQTPKPDADFREAIQIDFAGKTGLTWKGAPPTAPCNDGTHCQDIVITNCIFDNCPAGVGTHSLSKIEEYHERITIENCVFTNIHKTGIKLLGMKDVVIKNCKVDRILLNKKKVGHELTGGKVPLDDYRYNINVVIDNIEVL